MSPMWLAAWLGTAAHASTDCEAKVVQDVLVADIETAEQAWKALDLSGFRVASDVVFAKLHCTDTAFDPAFAARVHRLQGLRGFVQGDIDRAEAAFAAARRAAPDQPLPESFAPSSHPIRTHYSALPIDQTSEAPLPPGDWRIDGSSATTRATLHPAVVQKLEKGELVGTAYTWPEEPLPFAPVDSIQAPGKGRWFAVGAGGAAVLSGVLYGTALASLDTLTDPSTPRADRPGLRDTTNRRVLLSGAAGTVGVGLAVTALVVPW